MRSKNGSLFLRLSIYFSSIILLCVCWLAGWLADLLLYCIVCFDSLIAFCTATTSERVYRQTNSSLSWFPFVVLRIRDTIPHTTQEIESIEKRTVQICIGIRVETYEISRSMCLCTACTSHVCVSCKLHGIRNTKSRLHTKRIIQKDRGR